MFLGMTLIIIAIGIYSWLENIKINRIIDNNMSDYTEELVTHRLIKIVAKIVMIISGFSGIIFFIQS